MVVDRHESELPPHIESDITRPTLEEEEQSAILDDISESLRQADTGILKAKVMKVHSLFKVQSLV